MGQAPPALALPIVVRVYEDRGAFLRAVIDGWLRIADAAYRVYEHPRGHVVGRGPPVLLPELVSMGVVRDELDADAVEVSPGP